MRYRLMATYLGVPYHAGLGPDGNDVTLFSPGPPPEELGFTAAPGHWRKQVSVNDLSALWQSRLVGEYRGEPCLVLDDLGERLHVVYLGRDAVRARQLGYWEIDREVFEVVVDRVDVDGLVEERREFPLSAAMFPPSNPAPPAGPQQPGPSGPEPLFDVFKPAGGPPMPSPENDPEPETLIQARLDTRGRAPRASAGSAGPPGAARPPGPPGPPGPKTRMEPIPSARAQTPPAYPGQGPRPTDQAPGYPGQGPRTTDQAAAWHGSPAPGPWSGRGAGPPGPGPAPRPGSAPSPAPAASPAAAAGPGVRAGRRTARKDRVSPQSVFAELLGLAGIPQSAYAVDEEVPGAMCLVKAEGGFEVFSCTKDARLEVHLFQDQEAAYFYLFGVLAAEAIRSRRLGPTRPNGYVNGSGGAAGPSEGRVGRENVSKYLRYRKLPTFRPHPVILNKPAGLTVPRSPSSLAGLSKRGQ